jgi:cell division septation protein DedD
MRNLFLALVLANLAFAAWHSWFSTPPRVPRVTNTNMPSIQLASEIDVSAQPTGPAPRVPEDANAVIDAATGLDRTGPAQTSTPSPRAESVAAVSGPDQRVAPPVTSSPPGVAAASCVTVGPFRELSQAATAAGTLRNSGFDPMQRAGEGDIWVGYWVYIAAIPTQAEAEEILSKLRQSGISDSYVIPNSDSGNLVSLGVFTEIARAGSRLAEVRKLGYEATVADRTRRATVYWVDVMPADGQSLDFESLQPPGRISRLEQRPCE